MFSTLKLLVKETQVPQESGKTMDYWLHPVGLLLFKQTKQSVEWKISLFRFSVNPDKELLNSEK